MVLLGEEKCVKAKWPRRDDFFGAAVLAHYVKVVKVRPQPRAPRRTLPIDIVPTRAVVVGKRRNKDRRCPVRRGTGFIFVILDKAGNAARANW